MCLSVRETGDEKHGDRRQREGRQDVGNRKKIDQRQERVL